MDRLPTTIEDFAAMINTQASKEDITRVEVRLDGIESRLGRIENLLLEAQKRKLEKLEVRVKRLEDAVALQATLCPACDEPPQHMAAFACSTFP
jgi:hypothetical protein